MNQKRMKLFFVMLVCIALTLPAVIVNAATTITSNQTGT